MRYDSGFYQQVIFLTAVKTIWLDHGRFSGTPYRVCPYSTTYYGFDIDGCFKSMLNHLVRKIMVDLVVHHIEFAHIQPLNMVLIMMLVFIVGLPAGYFFNCGQNHLVGKTILD